MLQVYDRLQKLNISMSHSQLLRLVDKLGSDHDARVLNWRDSLTAKMENSISPQVCIYSNVSAISLFNYSWDYLTVRVFCSDPYIMYEGDHLSSSDESLDSDPQFDSDSDYSYQAVSPITSEEEYDTSESTDESENALSKSASLPSSSFSLDHQEVCLSAREQNDSHSQTKYCLCGDNIDKTVKQRYMRSGTQKAGSIHYFHSYAVANRIDFSPLSEQTPPLPSVDIQQLAASLLPPSDDEVALRKNFAILVSCVLVANIKFFNTTFDGVVEWHIKHEFYKQMSKKSEVVSKLLAID